MTVAPGDDLKAEPGGAFGKACGVFRAGEGFSKAGQAESVVDALAQDSARFPFPFQQDDIPLAAVAEPQRRGESRPGRPR